MTMPYNITTITDWGINNQYLSIFYGELLKNNINIAVKNGNTFNVVSQ